VKTLALPELTTTARACPPARLARHQSTGAPGIEERVKIPAAWLLEQAGFVKGYGEGAAGISTRHTLALTNRGGATCADMERLQQEIVRGVEARFGIALEREPVLLG